MPRTYTFNRPLAALFLVPLLLLCTMLFLGLLRQFSFMVALTLVITLAFSGWIVWHSLLRRLRIAPEKATWLAPGTKREMALADVRHFGLVKYRSFRFIYFSDSENDPFSDPEAPIVPGPHTFVFQFRPAAWQLVQEWIRSAHPDLQPSQRQRK